jgi:hypothetical protein
MNFPDRIFLCAALVIGPATGAAAAERLRLGPANVAAAVNGTQLSAVLTGEVAADSSDGDVNLDGEVVVTAKLKELETGVAKILDPMLPHKFDLSGDSCSIEVKQLRDFKITYAASSYEARLSGTMACTLDCTIGGDGDVGFDISLQPNTSDKAALGWKILSKSRIDAPWFWRTLARLVRISDLSAFVLEKAQSLLNEKATLALPKMAGGINAAFKGANFDGAKDNLQLRIKGDAHANAATVTSYLQLYLDRTPLEFTFKLSQ